MYVGMGSAFVRGGMPIVEWNKRHSLSLRSSRESAPLFERILFSYPLLSLKDKIFTLLDSEQRVSLVNSRMLEVSALGLLRIEATALSSSPGEVLNSL